VLFRAIRGKRLGKDARRDRELQRLGYRVLRVSAADVCSRLDSVLARIRAALAAWMSLRGGPLFPGSPRVAHCERHRPPPPKRRDPKYLRKLRRCTPTPTAPRFHAHKKTNPRRSFE
jgi:hypothetical protein